METYKKGEGPYPSEYSIYTIWFRYQDSGLQKLTCKGVTKTTKALRQLDHDLLSYPAFVEYGIWHWACIEDWENWLEN